MHRRSPFGSTTAESFSFKGLQTVRSSAAEEEVQIVELWCPSRREDFERLKMLREELSAREEFTYNHVSSLERGSGTAGRRGDRTSDRRSERGERDRPERDSFTVDVRASDLQLAQPERLRHPCFSYRAWLYSVLIGGIPAAIAGFAIAKNRNVAVSDFQVVYVSTFAVTTTCLVWFGCKLVLNPSAVNINFNLILMILLEVLMASTVILSARSAEDCCRHRKKCNRSGSVKPAVFPTRLLKAYSVIEVIVGISAVFGGIIALNMDALLPGPYLSVTFFWILVACFPSAIASHVVSEYPTKCLVEALIAISSVTSPLLFSASGFLSCSVVSFVEMFLHDVPTSKQSYDILLLILMVLLLVQAVLTSATVVHCATYKGRLRAAAPEREDSMQIQMHYSEQHLANGTLPDFDKDRAWKAVVVQMAQ
uniref:Modulator of VRAC current 1 n=1 Tax=Oryzias melastigma TaxID=30732 RepID=A0A3B3E1T0_ORYME